MSYKIVVERQSLGGEFYSGTASLRGDSASPDTGNENVVGHNSVSVVTTAVATAKPTLRPSAVPSRYPTRNPTTWKPTATRMPTTSPTTKPTVEPTTATPTTQCPTIEPTTSRPTRVPTIPPSPLPSITPSFKPTRAPTSPFPSVSPSTAIPTISQRPTRFPILVTSKRPSISPTLISAYPTTRSPTRATLAPTAPWVPIELVFESSVTLSNVFASSMDKAGAKTIQQAYLAAMQVNGSLNICNIEEAIFIRSSMMMTTSISPRYGSWITKVLDTWDWLIQGSFDTIGKLLPAALSQNSNSMQSISTTSTTYDAVLWVQINYGIADSLQASDTFTLLRSRLFKAFNDGSFQRNIIAFAEKNKAVGYEEISVTGYQVPIDFIAKYYKKSEKSSLPPSSVGGIVIGVLFGVILMAFMIYYRWSRNRIVKVGPVVDGVGAKYQMQDGKLVFTPLKMKPQPKPVLNTPPEGSIAGTLNQASYAGEGSLGGPGEILVNGGSFNELFSAAGGDNGFDQYPGVIGGEPSIGHESYLSFNG